MAADDDPHHALDPHTLDRGALDGAEDTAAKAADTRACAAKAADAGTSTPDTAEGLRMLEGYLYWQAETARAQQDAERFADRLPWLTTGQREDVIRLYRQERLDSSRAFVDRVAHRARQLQREYTDRYQQLKLRLVAVSFAAVAGLVAAEACLHPIG